MNESLIVLSFDFSTSIFIYTSYLITGLITGITELILRLVSAFMLGRIFLIWDDSLLLLKYFAFMLESIPVIPAIDSDSSDSDNQFRIFSDTVPEHKYFEMMSTLYRQRKT